MSNLRFHQNLLVIFINLKLLKLYDTFLLTYNIFKYLKPFHFILFLFSSHFVLIFILYFVLMFLHFAQKCLWLVNAQYIFHSLMSFSFCFINPSGIYLLKVSNRNTRARCEICSKLTIKTHTRSGVFIVKSEHTSHLVLVFLLLILNI